MRGGADLRVREPEVSLEHLRDCSLAVCDFFRGNWHRRNGMVSYGKKGIVEYFSIRRKEWYFQLELE